MSTDVAETLCKLMQQQNRLLDQQNNLLRQLADGRESFDVLLEGEKIFVDDLWRDEVRNDFLVTSRRKRVWNIQLNLLAELDRICKKYGIRYFAYGGTLLGAVRHGGFVPWDDDVDISMLRPDYEKFKRVIAAEIKPPYFADAWHNYKLEDEEPEIVNDKNFLQIVKRDQREKHPKWWPFWPIIKLKDSRTTFIQYLDRPHVHQGIWIDVFPFDPVPPFSDKQHMLNFEVERELLRAIALPAEIKKALDENKPLLLKRADLEKILNMPHSKKAAIFDSFALKNFSPTAGFVGQLRGHCLVNKKFSYALKNFAKTIYLPFERIKIPAPIGFADCLTAQYGDWHKIKIFKQHAKIHSADIPYKEFFATVKQF